jgi:hypothetical protein
MNHAKVPEARVFILWPLSGVLASEHWSFSCERWMGSACVGVPTARLQAVAYKYRLFLQNCWSCLFFTVGGFHNTPHPRGDGCSDV